MDITEKPAGAATPDGLKKAANQGPDYRLPATEIKAACVDAVEFLEAMHPAPLPWVLTSINPAGKGIVTRTFKPGADRAEQARTWITSYEGRWNLYWHVNPPTADDLVEKASREEILEVTFLHLDLDPRDNQPLSEEQDRLRLLTGENLPPGIPVPTARVWSGNGVQLFWRLDHPIPINGDLALAEDAARYNRWIEAIFGGDQCHDVSRILRLPYTTNIPDETKRKKGRVIAASYVMEIDPARSFPLSAFEKAAPKTGSGGPAEKVSIIGPLPPVNLDDLPERVSQRIKAVIGNGSDPLDPKRYRSKSNAVMGVAVALVQAGCRDDVIASILLDRNYGISEHLYTQKGRTPTGCAARQIERARAKVAVRSPAADPTSEVADEDDEDKPTPMKLAQAWLNGRRSRLIRYDGEWLAYDAGAYVAREDEGIRSEVWRAYPKANSAIVSNIMDAAKGLIHHDKNNDVPPCWLDGRALPEPERLLALRNGILDLSNGILEPHTDELFTRNALAFDYDPKAPQPTRFLKFLDEVWPEQSEKDCHAALQQMFGYLLTPDTSQQKIFVMVGPPRSGKGTIGRLLESILGEPSVCSLTFSSMGTPFGRQSMIGKRLALVSDMRIGKLTDRAAVSETLLTISGEDTVSVPRKHMTDWSGHLPVRFVILSNEPPTLDDPSGALLSRYIILETHQSFRGSEDRTLDDQLTAELPGILNWAIDGWKALQQAGRFVQPADAADMADSITRIGSPIAAFVQDECELDPAATVRKDDVYMSFKAWCRDQDREHHGNKETFSKGLRVSCPSVRVSKERDGEDRYPVYRGLKLKPKRKPEPEPF